MRNSSYSFLFIQNFKRIRFDFFLHKSTKYTIYSNGLQIDSMFPHQTKHYIFMVEYVFMCLILNSSLYLTTGNIYLKATTMRIIKRFMLRFAQYALWTQNWILVSNQILLHTLLDFGSEKRMQKCCLLHLVAKLRCSFFFDDV